MTTQELLARARQARGAMALADTQTKDRALLAMAEELEADTAPFWRPTPWIWRGPGAASPR